MYLELERTPLTARISGGSSRDANDNGDIHLSSEGSYDPDLIDSSDVSSLQYQWECKELTSAEVTTTLYI